MLQPDQPMEACGADQQTRAGRGVAVLSFDGQWQGIDAGLGELFGRPAQTLLGQPAHRRLFPECAGQIDAALRVLSSGADAAVSLTCACRMPEGGERWLELDLGPLPGTAGTGLALLQVRDVGDVHRMEMQQQAAARQQEYWAYGISHDLRASLRVIEGFAARLQGTQSERLDDNGREWLGRIRGAATQAGGLIEAMLEYSRVATQAHEDVPVDASLLAEWVLAELQDAEPGRAADISIQPGLSVLGDERQLKRLFCHILHNAWKFSATRERIEIRVEGERAGPWVRIRIRDQGLGFDSSYADKLFQPFRRLHGREDGAGHGLGLAIAHRIVERHGGRIRAESAPGAGSTFHIELPAADAGEAT